MVKSHKESKDIYLLIEERETKLLLIFQEIFYDMSK